MIRNPNILQRAIVPALAVSLGVSACGSATSNMLGEHFSKPGVYVVEGVSPQGIELGGCLPVESPDGFSGIQILGSSVAKYGNTIEVVGGSDVWSTDRYERNKPLDPQKLADAAYGNALRQESDSVPDVYKESGKNIDCGITVKPSDVRFGLSNPHGVSFNDLTSPASYPNAMLGGVVVAPGGGEPKSGQQLTIVALSPEAPAPAPIQN